MDLYSFDDGGFVTAAESADEALTKLRAECQRIGFKETTILEISNTMQKCARPVFVRFTRSSSSQPETTDVYDWDADRVGLG